MNVSPRPRIALGDDLHGIQNARGGLTVHHGQVGDVRVFLQRAPHGLRRYGRRLLQGNEDVIQAMAAAMSPMRLRHAPLATISSLSCGLTAQLSVASTA